jgi:RNA polymerase sigma factor (sigma-70 family)
MPPMPLPGAHDHFTTYLDDAGSFARLTPDEERQQARELIRLRRACWEAAVKDPLHRRQLARLVTSDRDLSRRELVDAMMAADPECRALLEIESIAATPELRRARAAYLEARNRFMCAHLRFVVQIAKRYGRRYMALADRVQEGNLGLLKAIDRFDPERGFRFSTYAAWWIRHAVTEALIRNGRTVRIPAHLHTLFNKARLASIRLRGQKGRAPSLTEVAECVGAPVDAVRWATEAMELHGISLDQPSPDDGSLTVAEWLADETAEHWSERVGDRIDSRLADHMVDRLAPREAAILAHRFGLRGAEHLTLCALGERYDLTGERIRQLEKAALYQLRDEVESSDTRSIAYAV